MKLNEYLGKEYKSCEDFQTDFLPIDVTQTSTTSLSQSWLEINRNEALNPN